MALLLINRANSVALRLFIRDLFHVFATDAAAGMVMLYAKRTWFHQGVQTLTFEGMTDCDLHGQIVVRKACR